MLGDDRPGRRRVTVPPETAGPVFAHASEAEMARILDFYEVRWLYEPDTFPLLWNLSGAVAESFSPDFYLPDLDLYLEMTTLKQSLVRKKNRKLRRLRALYPDVRVKLFYARDFRALMLKYGRSALTASLSGTSGQVPPRRPVGDTLPSIDVIVAAGSAPRPVPDGGATPSTTSPRRPAAGRRAASGRQSANTTESIRSPEAPIER